MAQNPNSMKRLFADVLDSQLEPEFTPDISTDRLRESLTTGPALSAEERRSLWRSPLIRDEYLRIRRQLNAEIRSRVQERGLDLRIVGRAAADDTDELRYDSADGSFQITLMRQPEEDMPWLLLVTLSKAIRETLYPLTQIRLVDSGGLEWVRGRPDTRGELSFGWYDLENLPDQRLREHSLILEIL